MDFLLFLGAETLKAELLSFLENEKIEVNNKEDFKNKFIKYIKNEESYKEIKEKYK